MVRRKGEGDGSMNVRVGQKVEREGRKYIGRNRTRKADQITSYCSWHIDIRS